MLEISNMKKCVFAVLAMFVLYGFTGKEVRNNLLLWYNKPAANWNEALPIGNGRMGAMVFGGIVNEHLQLNDNTLYSGEPSQGFTGNGNPLLAKPVPVPFVNLSGGEIVKMQVPSGKMYEWGTVAGKRYNFEVRN